MILNDDLKSLTNHPSFFTKSETHKMLGVVYFVWFMSEMFYCESLTSVFTFEGPYLKTISDS